MRCAGAGGHDTHMYDCGACTHFFTDGLGRSSHGDSGQHLSAVTDTHRPATPPPWGGPHPPDTHTALIKGRGEIKKEWGWKVLPIP